jgi:dihydropteroate synthase
MRVQIMGIVNRTPDSFFDGGQYLDDSAARARVDRLVQDGADIIDVGCESTRPGAPEVSATDQIARLGDIIRYITRQGSMASVDTTSPEVAEHATRQGARMINSVALDPAGDLGRIAAKADADLVLTHCRGSMTQMAGFSQYRQDAYGDVVDDVATEWQAAAQLALSAGLANDRLIVDPGLGFTKNAAQSLELCARLGELKRRLGGLRVLVGPSRKSYIAATVAAERGGPPPEPGERLGGTIAAVVDCVARGADIVRVHDVAEVVQALAYGSAIGALSEAKAAGGETRGDAMGVGHRTGSEDGPSDAELGGGSA